MSSEIQYDPVTDGMKSDAETKVQGVREKYEHRCRRLECKSTKLVDEIQCEQDLNEMTIPTKVHGDHSVKVRITWK